MNWSLKATLTEGLAITCASSGSTEPQDQLFSKVTSCFYLLQKVQKPNVDTGKRRHHLLALPRDREWSTVTLSCCRADHGHSPSQGTLYLRTKQISFAPAMAFTLVPTLAWLQHPKYLQEAPQHLSTRERDRMCQGEDVTVETQSNWPGLCVSCVYPEDNSTPWFLWIDCITQPL